VRDEENGLAIAAQPLEPQQALLLKRGIAHCQYFVHEQDVWIDMHRHGEGQPHVHPARVVCNGSVQGVFDAGKVDDGIEAGSDFPFSQSQDGGVQEHILTAGEVRMKARPHFQQAADAAAQNHPPAIGSNDARQNLQQR